MVNFEIPRYRVGGLFAEPTSHTTVQALSHTAVSDVTRSLRIPGAAVNFALQTQSYRYCLYP